MSIRLNLCLAISCFMLVISFESRAATFTVNTAIDSNDGVCDQDCSLRDAITAANGVPSDDLIQFDPTVFSSASTITLASGQFVVQANGTLSINGPGRELLAINGNSQSRIFWVETGAGLNLTGIKLTGGRTFNTPGFTGGAIYSLGNLTITSSEISGNWAGQAGGGIYQSGGFLSINGSIINSNTNANDRGAGIFCECTLLVDNSTFSNNSNGGWHGGAILLIGTGTISNSTFTGNGSGKGGAIGTEGGLLDIENITATGNSGGAVVAESTTVNITDSTFSGNTATSGAGGGIYNYAGLVTLLRVTVSSNSANLGGGVHNSEVTGGAGTVIVTRSSIDSNSSNDGGGIFNSGTMSITDSFVGNNQVAGNGGGGGIKNARGSATVVNSTFANNSARIGGGMDNFDGVLTVESSTVSSNTAFNGGGIDNEGGTVSFRSTIIGDNSATNSFPDIAGTLVSMGYNLVENASGGNITGETAGNIIGRDPMLMPLANNGGPTLTAALQPNSPATDADDPSQNQTTDQRGVNRPADGDFDGNPRSDIGAYERNVSATLVVTKTSDTNDGTCNSDCSLREAVAAANASSEPEKAIIFDPAIFAAPQTISLPLGEIIFSNSGSVGIYGPSSGGLTVSGNNLSRIFRINTPVFVGIARMRIANGRANASNGGGISNFRGTMSLKNVTVQNHTSGNGGAIENAGGTLTIIDSVIDSNSATGSGGAITSSYTLGNPTLRIFGSTLSRNTSESAGGAVYSAVGPLEIVGTRFSNNTVTGSSNSGGGIQTSGPTSVLDSEFDGNTATDGGGAIRATNGSTIFVSNTRFERNHATTGGAIRFDGTTATFSESTFRNNTSGFRGAGILISSGTVNIAGSSFIGNTSNDDAGAVYNGGTLTITNSTITGNTAVDQAGGLYNAFAVTITNATIAKNIAANGGGVYNNGSAIASKNSIFAKNSAAFSPEFSGNLNSQGYNLIQSTSGVTISGATNGNILSTDPLLDPIPRSNGGKVPTLALLNGSPAIDKGAAVSGVTADQRGNSRPFDFPSIPNSLGGNGSDIGAYERNSTDWLGGARFDFDGDRRSDVSIFRPSEGQWWLDRSADGLIVFTFGTSADFLTPGDFTGDGKTDVAIFRPSTGEWFVLRSEDYSFYSFPFGIDEDIPVPGDYDGDGQTDAAVFRPSNSTWFIRRSSGGTTIEGFGSTDDFPVPADYDGDGKTDIAIYRPSLGQWWINRSTEGLIVYTFGNSTDKNVQGDYTGDGKADVAIWRPSSGEWFILRSEDASFYSFPFGSNGDLPAPGDYDGDGKTDAAVYRPSGATWYVNRSTAGMLIQNFGAASDLPVPNYNIRP